MYTRNPKFGDVVLDVSKTGMRKRGSIIKVDEKRHTCTIEYIGGFKETLPWDEMLGYVANSFGGLWLVRL